MSVSKIILNATGEQDDSLFKNSEFTFFKNKSSRHTNFAKTLVEIDSNKIQNNDTVINFGETIDFTIDKTSDLLLNLTVKFILQDNDKDINNWNNFEKIVPETLFALIDYIEIMSNDKVLQKLSGIWMYTYFSLYKSNNKHLFDNASANIFTKTNLLGETNKEYTLHLPIPFWFSKSSELAFPLCSLEYEKISVNIKINDFHKISKNALEKNYIIRGCKLLGEFIELTQTEKQTFLQQPLEYVIDQIEYNGPHNISVKNEKSLRQKIELEQHYLVKELIWICKEKNPNNLRNYFNFWHNNKNDYMRTDHFKNISILLNGRVLNPRFPASYYRLIQRNQHFKSDYHVDNDEKVKNNCIYSYSFNLNPEIIQSSGFLSFTKFNSIHLDLQMTSNSNTTKDRELFIFIKRFNIIRIKNGRLNILAN